MPVLGQLDVSVRPQNADAFEAWWAAGGAMMRAQKGFELAALGFAPGEPGSYTWVGRFSDADSFYAYLRGAPRAKHAEAGQALYTVRRGGQVYDLVNRVGDPALGANFNFAVLVEWTITGGPAASRKFAESRKEIGELRQKSVKGFLAQSTWRHLGTPNHYLITQAYAGPPEPSAEVAALMSAHPYTEYTTVPQSPLNLRVVQRIEA